ncbi:glycosyltransferase [Flavobacterium sufflavum]|uniref:Glycosyltransferase n=1 Tax=Flavobacterium sufflavum TaxID=1921138 RepID=A0A3S2U2F6_9FLAO|nr:glycosyltransferase [Flavobacterium sufflavum]RVT75900.1 glycosyltransferase [Flavobacterium sufflavum]
MKFLIVTHVAHTIEQQQYYGYAPYVREMNIWLKYVDELIVVAPLESTKPTAIDSFYKHKNIDFRKVSHLSFTNLKNTISSIFKLPKILLEIVLAMKQSDHIHLRCPGNMGLLACIVQLFFPSKPKTAKYAGNWDLNSKQPWSYRLQKWILSNTFLTRNMEVLVYGEWPNQSRNIKSFFTATYAEKEKEVVEKTINPDAKIKLMFVGSLVEGKNPLYAIQLLEQLRQTNKNVVLDIYGEGVLRVSLENYIEVNNLEEYIVLHGNQNKEVLKKAYQYSHFVVLPSKSEGWPKVIAEGMFWGAVPLATAVSCISAMLDQGKRGLLLEMDLEKDMAAINQLINNPMDFESKSKAAMDWSGNYTLDFFENEIQKLLQA